MLLRSSVSADAALIMHKRGFATIAAHVGGCLDLPRGRVVASPILPTQDTSSNQIEDLTNVEHPAQHRGPHHEVGENRLLSGPGYVAVHQVGAGTGVTLDFPGQFEAVVDVVEQVEEQHLEGGLGEEAQQVRPPQAAMLLAWVVVQPGILAVLGFVLAFPFFPVGHVQHHHEGGAGDEDQLERPQANVGDGEEVVVADVGAAWLTGVALKVSLVVAPDPLGGHDEDQHAEDKDHRQPDASEASGILVDSAEKTFKKLPIH